MSADYIDRLAKGLVEQGIKYAFGITGSGSSVRLISCLEQNNIPYYPVSHEAAAALMAGACSRHGITKAVAISIKGPGFINFLPGILSNFYEGRPALTISEAYAPHTQSYFKHKRLNHPLVCSSIIKGYATVDESKKTMECLFDLAYEEFPGPIHLDLCNKPVEHIEIFLEQKEGKHVFIKQEIDKVVSWIKKSRCPMIILGSMVSRQCREFLWEQIHVPILTTPAAKGCIDESSAYAAGVITGEGGDFFPENMILKEGDLIIAFGLRNTEIVRAKPFNIPLIIIDTIEGDIHDGFESQICLVAPEKDIVGSPIFSELKNKKWGEDIIHHHRSLLKNELFRDPWLPPAIFGQLQEQLSGEAILVLDTGLFCIIGEMLWKAQTQDSFCGSSNGRFMGIAIPTAIGIAVSNPKKDIICVFGDGGIGPYLSEIKIAIEEKLSILFVLMSDGQYGTVAMSGKNKGFSTRAFTIKNPGWWRVVESMGCPGLLISNLHELDKALVNWGRNQGPLFLEMCFDPTKYCHLIKRLRG